MLLKGIACFRSLDKMVSADIEGENGDANSGGAPAIQVAPTGTGTPSMGAPQGAASRVAKVTSEMNDLRADVNAMRSDLQALVQQLNKAT